MTDDGGASVQDALGAAGEPPRFTWRGQEYTIGFPISRVKARLEELIMRAETAAVQALRGIVPPADFQDQLARLGRLNAKREYRTREGSLWRKYMLGEEAESGFVLYLLALIREHHPEFAESDVRACLEEDGEFLLLAADRVVPGFFAFLGAELRLPPETTRAAAEKARAALLAGWTTPSATTP